MGNVTADDLNFCQKPCTWWRFNGMKLGRMPLKDSSVLYLDDGVNVSSRGDKCYLDETFKFR